MSNSVKLRENRAKLIEDGRKLLDKATSEGRGLNSEEKQQYDKIYADADALKSTIDDVERQERAEAELESYQPSQNLKLDEEARAKGENAGSKEARERKQLENRAFNKFIRDGKDVLTDEEKRALSVSASDAAGGYTVPPEDFRTELLKTRDDLVFVRNKATIFRMNKAKKLTVPRLAADPADADWTTELATGNADSTMAFGQFELDPTPMAKRLLVSNTLIRESVLPIEQLIRTRLAYKHAITEEKSFLTGDGSSQALGLFYASANGIPASRDVEFAGIAVDADTFKKARYNIKQAYWPNLEWIMARSTMQAVALLKDGNGQYLMQPGLAAGARDTVDGFEVNLSEYAPSTVEADGYLALLGDMSQYYIVDELEFTITRLVELYAGTNQIGFITRMEVDGKPGQAEAFTRLVCPSS